MADVTYRANLKASSFPFLSELFGRSVIVRGQDQNYIPGLAAKDTIDSAAGIPQIYYAHNVVPSDSGYRAVGYDIHTAQIHPSSAGFTEIHILRDGTGASVLFTTDAVGNSYIQETGSTTWKPPVTRIDEYILAGKRITTAFVSGVTYIYVAEHGAFTYDIATNVFTAITLTGLTATDILGIAANSGYLLAYSGDAIAWSSTTDPTNFTPSLETGAGGGSVEGVRGTIVTVEEVYGGLVIFATDNCVAAEYSGNPRYPYKFTSLPGAGGLQSASNVTADVGSGILYAYTESGMQSITLRQAQTVFPDVTDYISGGLFETYNEVTDELETVDAIGSVVHKRIVLISDRYVVVSYGVDSLTHALIYDTALKQWGRLKIDHVDCFEFLQHPSETTELPKHSIAFLTAGGGIQILNSDIGNTAANGVMLLGKFQYVRSRMLQLQSVEFENVNAGNTFTLMDFPAIDGKNFEGAVEGYLSTGVGKLRKYLFHNTAMNHTICCKGAFNAVSLVLTFNVAGAR